MSEILPIVQLLHHYANLQPPVTITFEQLIKFIAYSSHLKDNLLLVLGPAILLFSLMGAANLISCNTVISIRGLLDTCNGV